MPIEPIYTRIVADIRAKIASGELKPGDKLPSVAQLRAQYDASNTAVRNAMLVLREAGVVEGHQGKGVYVRKPEK
ncbi:GntR family transcriptional regulator [Plantactinospora sp. BC1]|uniref:winged helix-turn-helix domain-containing protein n=1 Tax=Plantactinospora sp. BC1 TaxID=2108470 RepID=UPI000D17102E|nr:winged helix-turn-helix domain-containing protein [Plantactinospora sp. BC1]AVT32260.1 GntR family transcriptional regulator [Plantactinospora sp. BC1]